MNKTFASPPFQTEAKRNSQIGLILTFPASGWSCCSIGSPLIDRFLVTFFLPIIPGDITFIVEFVVESMVWLNDFSNSGSLAYQQLSAKFQKAVGKKFLIEVFL